MVFQHTVRSRTWVTSGPGRDVWSMCRAYHLLKQALTFQHRILYEVSQNKYGDMVKFAILKMKLFH